MPEYPHDDHYERIRELGGPSLTSIMDEVVQYFELQQNPLQKLQQCWWDRRSRHGENESARE